MLSVRNKSPIGFLGYFVKGRQLLLPCYLLDSGNVWKWERVKMVNCGGELAMRYAPGWGNLNEL